MLMLSKKSRGDLEGKGKLISVQDRREIVTLVELGQSKGLSQRQSCKAVGITPLDVILTFAQTSDGIKKAGWQIKPERFKARMTAVTETIPVSAVFSVCRAKGVRRVYIF